MRLPVQPPVKPLADGEPPDQVLAGPETPPSLLDIGQGRLLVADLLQHVGDQFGALGVVGVGETEQSADVVEVGLGGLEALVAGTAEGAAGAVLAGREFLAYGVGAVLAAVELGALLAERLAGLRVAAVAAAVGGALQRSFSSVVLRSLGGRLSASWGWSRGGGVPPSSRMKARAARSRSLWLGGLSGVVARRRAGFLTLRGRGWRVSSPPAGSCRPRVHAVRAARWWSSWARKLRSIGSSMPRSRLPHR